MLEYPFPTLGLLLRSEPQVEQGVVKSAGQPYCPPLSDCSEYKRLLGVCLSIFLEPVVSKAKLPCCFRRHKLKVLCNMLPSEEHCQYLALVADEALPLCAFRLPEAGSVRIVAVRVLLRLILWILPFVDDQLRIAKLPRKNLLVP